MQTAFNVGVAGVVLGDVPPRPRRAGRLPSRRRRRRPARSGPRAPRHESSLAERRTDAGTAGSADCLILWSSVFPPPFDVAVADSPPDELTSVPLARGGRWHDLDHRAGHHFRRRPARDGREIHIHRADRDHAGKGSRSVTGSPCCVLFAADARINTSWATARCCDADPALHLARELRRVRVHVGEDSSPNSVGSAVSRRIPGVVTSGPAAARACSQARMTGRAVSPSRTMPRCRSNRWSPSS